jgi:peptidoglycan/LPS O-acetylase OafA/YrhL
MHRLSPIDGLRGYLVVWVLIGHVLIGAAYEHPSGMLGVVHSGGLAVNCFMIISGFVIFMLLDKKKEHYGIFMLRRFFRIYPAYLVLLLLSVPCLLLSRADFLLPHQIASPGAVAAMLQTANQIWADRWIHLPLHLTLLQGLVPERLLPHAVAAFLGPAWSLSLEWQFYLVAPLWFALAFSKSAWRRGLMYAICLVVILGNRHLYPTTDQGADLPFQLSYFLLGMISYLLYQVIEKLRFKGDFLFPLTFLLAVGIFQIIGKPHAAIPFLFWALMMGIILEPSTSYSSRLLIPLFTNRFSLWVGKISYSVYLSHVIMLTICHYLLLKYYPTLTQKEFFILLLVMTLTTTLLFSALLYHTIEAPFIEIGKKLARRWSRPAEKLSTA